MVYGIHQSDVIIRSAIIAGLEELRDNPWLLDFCFRGLRYDGLTSEEYGDREIQNAVRWFLSTRVDVRMADIPDVPSFPLINIMLHSSVEDAPTLGDVHYDPVLSFGPREVGRRQAAVIESFTPSSVEDQVVTLPPTLSTAAIVPGVHILFDPAYNLGYPIERIVSDRSFQIVGTPKNLAGLRVLPKDDTYAVNFESSVFRETYIIGVHAVSEQKYAIYLHSVLMFLLLRNRQRLLEGRGFDRTTITSGPLDENQFFASAERVFSRTVQVAGYVRQYWPKAVSERVADTRLALDYDAEMW